MARSPRLGRRTVLPKRDRASKMEKVTQEKFKISGVSELALGVADLERAERFYAGTLGLPVVERWGDAIWVMAGNRTRIGLWLVSVAPIAGERGGGHVHFALHTS